MFLQVLDIISVDLVHMLGHTLSIALFLFNPSESIYIYIYLCICIYAYTCIYTCMNEYVLLLGLDGS